MNDLSRPAASARCSCDISLRSRYSRNTFPNAHFGPLVGCTCARFRPRFRVAN
jgi:hypothetical protein